MRVKCVICPLQFSSSLGIKNFSFLASFPEETKYNNVLTVFFCTCRRFFFFCGPGKLMSNIKEGNPLLFRSFLSHSPALFLPLLISVFSTCLVFSSVPYHQGTSAPSFCSVPFGPLLPQKVLHSGTS